jgi:hypothetical protein
VGTLRPVRAANCPIDITGGITGDVRWPVLAVRLERRLSFTRSA